QIRACHESAIYLINNRAREKKGLTALAVGFVFAKGSAIMMCGSKSGDGLRFVFRSSWLAVFGWLFRSI
ncbi:hypothetical protein PP178_14170, partial [Zeaxanthinibacter sp. PT1]|uniref:hypothetical protein n=1 Tax=Zeaxanthinibacter TaxID=561554 RepID=UPI00234B4C9F